MDLAKAVAIVTGGTGGLGRRICQALTQRGTQVAIVYQQRQTEAEALARELREQGGTAITAGADVASAEAIHGLVDKVVREFGRVDILVNDAAYNKWIPFPRLDELSLDDWARILNVNLTGPFLCAKAVAPIMKRAGQGRIINIGSVAGLAPIGSSIAYAVSKAALIHLTRCLAVALAPEVLVNCVAPGFMEGTRMSEALSAEYQQRARQAALTKSAVDKNDVADAVLEFCRTESITGQTLVVDGGRVFH